MLNHHHQNPVKPKRVVILGAQGFVGMAAQKRLHTAGIECVALGRDAVDLTHADAAEKLKALLLPTDVLVIISAKAPCKDYTMLLQNIQMMHSVCEALQQKPVQQVVYISSDAVYADSSEKLTEASPAAPTSLHGAMHLAREQMLRSVVSEDALVILRPSLLYGASDPHNGYGPNRFYRLAMEQKTIALFGQGEEKRDHVYIEDVAEIIYLCLVYKSYGILNITTGEVTSFAEIIALLQTTLEKTIEVTHLQRQGPMPHNGYRAFDNRVMNQAFASFQYTGLAEGLKKMHQEHQA